MKKIYIALMISSFLLCSCSSEARDTNDTSTTETSSSFVATVNEEDTSETTVVSTTRETETTESSPTDQAGELSDAELEAYWAELRAELDVQMEGVVEWYTERGVLTDAPYESAITTLTSDEILDEYLFWVMRIGQSSSSNIGVIYKDYGIECLRDAGRTEHGNWMMYSIHKLASGAVFYCFYRDHFLYNTMLMTKSLTKADFSGIKTGDTVEDVAEIEPAAAYWKNIRVRNKELYPDSYEGEEGFTTPFLLKDGLLIIIYELRDNDYYIEDIVFHDDFKSVYPDFKYHLTSEADVYDYRILPEDYPD